MKIGLFMRKAVIAVLPYGLIRFLLVKQQTINERLKTAELCKYKSEQKIGGNIFDLIYKNNYWGSAESKSGKGSELKTTKIIRRELPFIWKKLGIKSFLDVPCGDYNWMSTVDKTDIQYIGGDIVTEIIESNKKKNEQHNVSFIQLDITVDKLPKVDMIFCKDCIQHLSNSNTIKVLKNFAKSGAKYLSITSYAYTSINWDIEDGDFRPLNLAVEPFNLPEPLIKIHESSFSGNEPDKIINIYYLDDIKEIINML